MSARHKHYAAPNRPKLESQFGLAGAWDGKRGRLRPPSPRQGPPFGGLSPEEFAALSPEEKISLGNGAASMSSFRSRLMSERVDATVAHFNREYPEVAEHVNEMNDALIEAGLGRIIVKSNRAGDVDIIELQMFAERGAGKVVRLFMFHDRLTLQGKGEYPRIAQEGWQDHATRRDFLNAIDDAALELFYNE